MSALAERGRTAMYIASDGILAGIVAVADPVRASAAEAITALHAAGVRTVMLTGDQNRTATAVAGVFYPAFGLLLRPEWAALLMSASTVIVTVNALLIRQRVTSRPQPAAAAA